jgi:hypothetical protein
MLSAVCASSTAGFKYGEREATWPSDIEGDQPWFVHGFSSCETTSGA